MSTNLEEIIRETLEVTGRAAADYFIQLRYLSAKTMTRTISVRRFLPIIATSPQSEKYSAGVFPEREGGCIGIVSAGYAGNKKAHQSRRSKFTAGGLIPEY